MQKKFIQEKKQEEDKKNEGNKRVMEHRSNEFKDLDDVSNYYHQRSKKLDTQMAPAETNLFKDCVFFILGYVGRGESSRYAMTKLIEKNGGRTVMMVCASVTHVIAEHICHSKRNQLDKAIEKRKVVVVRPDFIFDCVAKQQILDPSPYFSSKQKAATITQFFKTESDNKENIKKS